MLFGGGPIQTRNYSLGPVGNLSVPIGRRVDDVEDYVAAKTGANGDISYFTPGLSLDEVVDDGIRRTADGDIVSHGIRYDSLRDLVMYGDYYPLSADTEAIFRGAHADPTVPDTVPGQPTARPPATGPGEVHAAPRPGRRGPPHGRPGPLTSPTRGPASRRRRRFRSRTSGRT